MPKGYINTRYSKALEEIYGFEASHETISNVTDKNHSINSL